MHVRSNVRNIHLEPVKIIVNPNALFGGLISFGPATANHYNVWETPFFLILAVFGGCLALCLPPLMQKYAIGAAITCQAAKSSTLKQFWLH